MKYRKADPAIRMLLSARDEMAAGRGNARVGFVKKVLAEAHDRRLLVILRGDAPPEDFRDREWHRMARNVWSVTLSPDEIRDLDGCDEVVYYEEARRLKSALCSTCREIEVPHASEDASIVDRLTGEGVIIGVIDDGIDFRQKDFLDPFGKTRILWLWDQGADGPNPPAGWSQGMEYSRQKIDEAIRGEGLAIELPSRRHGTHVTGIAAGNGTSGSHDGCNGPHRGVAPERSSFSSPPPRRISRIRSTC